MNNQKDVTVFTISTNIYLIRSVLPTVLGCCLFFLGAGSWSITRGWIYFIIAGIAVIISNIFIAKKNPGLLQQRSKIRKGSKKWDKTWLLTIMLFFMYGTPVIAGYDIGRLGNQIDGISIYIGIVSFLLTTFLGTWAMTVNKFFEVSVRIQEDRGHYVIMDGPYRFVRHPGYTAIILWAIGFPLIVGSLLALYVGLGFILALAMRTFLEDNTLKWN